MKKIIIFLLLFMLALIFPIGCANNQNNLENKTNNVLSIYNW